MSNRARLNRVLAVVLVVWGGGIVISTLVRGIPSAESAYSAGRLTAFIFGFVLLAAGVRALVKKHPS
jgi:hypothetical protein